MKKESGCPPSLETSVAGHVTIGIQPHRKTSQSQLELIFVWQVNRELCTEIITTG